MSKKIILLAFFGAVLASAALTACKAPSKLTVKVTENGSAVEGAIVVLSWKTWEKAEQKTMKTDPLFTNRDGKVDLGSRPSGQYKIEVFYKGPVVRASKTFDHGGSDTAVEIEIK